MKNPVNGRVSFVSKGVQFVLFLRPFFVIPTLEESYGQVTARFLQRRNDKKGLCYVPVIDFTN